MAKRKADPSDAEPDTILADAQDAYKECEEAWSEQSTRELEDRKFSRLGGEHQWPEQVVRQRQIDGRPCHTTNFLDAFVKQVVNNCRQNKPAIKVHPVDDIADPDTAEVFSGLIRNIEATSDADVAYDRAVECAVDGGRGYFRINTKYTTDDTFDQDIVIESIGNPDSVKMDPYTTAADSSDWNVCFVLDSLSEKKFKREYKGAVESSFTTDDYSRLEAPWYQAKMIGVAEWWSREDIKRQIIACSLDEIPPALRASLDADKLMADTGLNLAIAEDQVHVIDLKVYEANKDLFDALGAKMIGKPRTVPSYKVTQRIISGVEVLETVEWAGKYIPIIPVYGDEVNIEGKRHFQSLITHAKDPQRRFNYWDSAATEMVALQPKAPYVGEEEAFLGVDAEKWANANTTSYAYLSHPKNTQAPQRQPPAVMPAAEIQQSIRAHDDIKATTGIYDASLGQRSNETSGKAILARQNQGNTGTFHFSDNQSRGIRQGGRVIIDLIPHVFSAARVVRTLGPDGKTPRNVPLKTPTQVPGPDGQPKQEQGPDGQMVAISKIYDLTVGKYDLTVSAGPSYNSRREEAASQMIELIRAYPQAAPLIGDLLAKNLDWPGADEIAARLKAMLPAQATGGESPDLVAAKQQLEQLSAVLKQLQGQNEALKADKATSAAADEARAQADLAKVANDTKKIRIDAFNAETNRFKAEFPKGVTLPAEAEPQIVAMVLRTIGQLLDSPDMIDAGGAVAEPEAESEIPGALEGPEPDWLQEDSAMIAEPEEAPEPANLPEGAEAPAQEPAPL